MVFVPPPLPAKPGVYIYKDKQGKILYIGKAKALNKRVASYFTKSDLDEKTSILVERIADMDFIVTTNETEAFLLENRLIKQNKPEYNIMLKDNERYAYITITAEKFPRLMTARQITDKKAKYFGPYASGTTRVHIVKTLNEAFKLRSCKIMPKHVCLYYHIGKCSGPCQGKISVEEYANNVHNATQYLQGREKELIESLAEQMKAFAKKQDFERAAQRRDAIYALENIQQRQHVDTIRKYNQDVFGTATKGSTTVVTVFNLKRGSIIKKTDFTFKDHINPDDLLAQCVSQYYEDHDIPSQVIIDAIDHASLEGLRGWLSEQAKTTIHVVIPQKGINKKLLELAQENASYSLENTSEGIVRLQKALKLPETPRIIECFDISTIGGKHTVASMVQFKDGQPNNSEYRRFAIKTVDLSRGPDDFSSIKEVVRRRYLKLKLNKERMPDLVIIDGGKGQLNAALQALHDIQISLPVISIAKKEEEIFVPGLQWSIRLSRRDEALKLIQRIRNEAHRFAITYHRLVRDKKSIEKSIDKSIDDGRHDGKHRA